MYRGTDLEIEKRGDDPGGLGNCGGNESRNLLTNYSTCRPTAVLLAAQVAPKCNRFQKMKSKHTQAKKSWNQKILQELPLLVPGLKSQLVRTE